MIAALTILLGNERLARRVALIGGGAILLLVLLGIGKCSYDRHVIAQHEAAVTAKATKAGANADAQRQIDTTRILANDQEIKDALAPLPDAPLSDRQHVRACTVWMQQHRGAQKPAGC